MTFSVQFSADLLLELEVDELSIVANRRGLFLLDNNTLRLIPVRTTLRSTNPTVPQSIKSSTWGRNLSRSSY